MLYNISVLDSNLCIQCAVTVIQILKKKSVIASTGFLKIILSPA